MPCDGEMAVSAMRLFDTAPSSDIETSAINIFISSRLYQWSQLNYNMPEFTTVPTSVEHRFTTLVFLTN
jgi:hypothetical protein